MKFSGLATATLALLPAVSNGFTPVFQSKTSTKTALASTIVTGKGGKPARSFEEDLALTLQIIMDHQARSATVSKDQFLVQMKEMAAVEVTEPVDVSIPYDAAARLAYEASDKSLDYAAFKTKYEDEAVALVKSKRPAPAAKVEAPKAAVAAPPAAAVVVDLSIPYDAAARLAYEASDKSLEYAAFKIKYEQEAVAMVTAKRPSKPAAVPAPVAAAPPAVDLSIPYDSAARLAYEASDKSTDFATFQKKYVQDTVAMVTSKKPVDLSIPYDAPARLAFLKSDRSIPYAEFRSKYEADAVAEVVAKKAKKE